MPLDRTQFDELYSISDLHMGGPAGFQIFDQGDLLGRFVRSIRDRPAGKRVALVINGDTVDFLAEPNPKHFNPEGAAGALDRIMGDPSFSNVFEALADFVAVPNRNLILTLGNHDIEFALPWVRRRLIEALSRGVDAAKGRITTAFDGEGFACEVGGLSVFCIHGNDVDQWNMTDYEKLRQAGSAFQRGKDENEWLAWEPNAGTKMVIDVMNSIKKQYAFVDLLKPEAEAVVPALTVLNPDLKSKLDEAWRVAKKLKWDKVKRTFRSFLSAEEEAEDENAAESLDQFLGGKLSRSAGGGRESGEDLLAEIEENVGADPMSMVGGASADKLGAGGAFIKRIMGADRHVVLHEALEGLEKDRSFEPSNSDDATYKAVDAMVGSEYDIVITGHTHQWRSLPRLSGSGRYFNSGTWVGLMRFSDEMLKDADSFKPVFDAMAESKSMQALKQADPVINGKKVELVMNLPGVVEVRKRSGSVQGSLRQVVASGAAGVSTRKVG